MAVDVRVEPVRGRAYTIPTDLPEADGTASRDSATIIVVHAEAGGPCGIGYIHADAPAAAAHRHLGCAAPRLRHRAWFHDHNRIEHLLFHGAPLSRAGGIAPDPTPPGFGCALRQQDAKRFAAAPGAG